MREAILTRTMLPHGDGLLSELITLGLHPAARNLQQGCEASICHTETHGILPYDWFALSPQVAPRPARGRSAPPSPPTCRTTTPPSPPMGLRRTAAQRPPGGGAASSLPALRGGRMRRGLRPRRKPGAASLVHRVASKAAHSTGQVSSCILMQGFAPSMGASEILALACIEVWSWKSGRHRRTELRSLAAQLLQILDGLASF